MFFWYNIHMIKEIKDLTDEELIEYITALQKKNEELKDRCGRLESKYDRLEKEHSKTLEHLDKLKRMLFGQSSEKRKFIDDSNQLSILSDIFNEAEAFAKDAGKEELQEIQQISTKVRKKKRTREELLAALPVLEEICDLAEGKPACDACGSSIRYLGKEHVRDEIVIVPQKMYIKRLMRKNYVCDTCHQEESVARIIKSDIPEPVIKHSLASPEALAHVAHQKFANAMPLARQEKDWCYQGVNVGRATLGNWVIKAANEHLIPFYARMKEVLLSGKVVAADETAVQVLKEENRLPTAESRMWVYRSMDHENSPSIVLFEYQPTRQGACAQRFLKGFKGLLMTDAYGGYNAVESVTHCYCWAHMRRYLRDALPKKVKDSAVKKGLDYCDLLFDWERKWKELKNEERQNERRKHAEPILDEYFDWVKSLDVLEGSKLGKAITYAKNQEAGLRNSFSYGGVEISNNRIEGNIRKFVIGRNNWITVSTPAGAKASALWYSIVITATENNLNIYEYLKYLMQRLPQRRKTKDTSILEECLPWSKTLPAECYLKPKTDTTNEKQMTLTT